MDGIVENTGTIFTVEREVCGYPLCVGIKRIGEDLLISVEGGQKPHIGCVIKSIPRLSLTGDGSYSASSSVLNLSGHKDEYLCRKLSEQICVACQTTVVCTGGVHIDQITKEEIREIIRTVEELGNVVIRHIKKRNEDSK
ncbi:hypothetical protein [uncultured Eubacterium sp.]|uniref:prenylated flavin chaperone LpdD n=1 Tax=uncultured Eubacterium sp. TaxID=165185 RepID=UPI0025E48923|nr:hypothetical protein [uncultured Eubacterium sp.]